MLNTSCGFSVCVQSTGGSHLSQIFWEHENLSGLSVIWHINIKLYKEKEKEFWQKIQAKQESGLTTVWLKWDPPVYEDYDSNVVGHICAMMQAYLFNHICQ